MAAKTATETRANEGTAKDAPSPVDRSIVAEEIVVIASESTGDLAKLLSALAEQAINLKAISIPQASTYGVFRFLAEPHEGALDLLRKQAIPFQICPVLAVELADHPGALGHVFARLAGARVEVKTVYGSIGLWGGPALLVIQATDVEAARRALLAEN